MINWLGSIAFHRAGPGVRVYVAALGFLMTAVTAQAAGVPVRPNRRVPTRVLAEPVHHGGVTRAPRAVVRSGRHAAAQPAESKEHGTRSHRGKGQRVAEVPAKKKSAPGKRTKPSKRGRKSKHAEPEEDSGVELQRVRGRAVRQRVHAAPEIARAVALEQPRWRVHALPAPPLTEGANLAPLMAAHAKPLPVVSAGTASAATLNDLREAGVLKTDEAEAIRAPSADTLLHATPSQIVAEAELPMVLPGTYRDGRMFVGPLRGSREVLVHQNRMADDAGLERIRNDAQLGHLRAARKLVDFPEGNGLAMNPPLPYNRRCARPWTVRFAADIAKAYSARFGEPLVVTSAVRTMSYQRRLQRVNGNAAAVDGDGASPHLTGQALDFGKRGMGPGQLDWMRSYLLPLMQAGKIDVEEEFQQACFHISVYRSYAPVKAKATRVDVAQLR